jgi:hypothetical protein
MALFNDAGGRTVVLKTTGPGQNTFLRNAQQTLHESAHPSSGKHFFVLPNFPHPDHKQGTGPSL